MKTVKEIISGFHTDLDRCVSESEKQKVIRQLIVESVTVLENIDPRKTSDRLKVAALENFCSPSPITVNLNNNPVFGLQLELENENIESIIEAQLRLGEVLFEATGQKKYIQDLYNTEVEITRTVEAPLLESFTIDLANRVRNCKSTRERQQLDSQSTTDRFYQILNSKLSQSTSDGETDLQVRDAAVALESVISDISQGEGKISREEIGRLQTVVESMRDIDLDIKKNPTLLEYVVESAKVKVPGEGSFLGKGFLEKARKFLLTVSLGVNPLSPALGVKVAIPVYDKITVKTEAHRKALLLSAEKDIKFISEMIEINKKFKYSPLSKISLKMLDGTVEKLEYVKKRIETEKIAVKESFIGIEESEAIREQVDNGLKKLNSMTTVKTRGVSYETSMESLVKMGVFSDLQKNIDMDTIATKIAIAKKVVGPSNRLTQMENILVKDKDVQTACISDKDIACAIGPKIPMQFTLEALMGGNLTRPIDASMLISKERGENPIAITNAIEALQNKCITIALDRLNSFDV